MGSVQHKHVAHWCFPLRVRCILLRNNVFDFREHGFCSSYVEPLLWEPSGDPWEHSPSPRDGWYDHNNCCEGQSWAWGQWDENSKFFQFCFVFYSCLLYLVEEKMRYQLFFFLRQYQLFRPLKLFFFLNIWRHLRLTNDVHQEASPILLCSLKVAQVNCPSLMQRYRSNCSGNPESPDGRSSWPGWGPLFRP